MSLSVMLGGLVLLCGLGLVAQTRLPAMIGLYRAQALALATALFWQGYLWGDDDLYLAGLITLALHATALPAALRRQGRDGTAAALPTGVTMALSAGVVGVAVLAVLPMGAVAALREALVPALSVILLGLLMVTVRSGVAQVVGLLMTGNGLVLAATSLPGLPFVALFTLALLVLPAFLLAGLHLAARETLRG